MTTASWSSWKATPSRTPLPAGCSTSSHRPRPPSLLFEDVHWADEATLDVLRIVGRRIESVPAVLVVSYRDDELDRSHPLRAVLGELPSRGVVTRLPVSCLSRDAVAALAEPGGRRR